MLKGGIMVGNRKINQSTLGLTMDLDSHIEKNNIVRTIRKLVEELDTSFIDKQYGKYGRKSYPVKDMLATILYAYTQGVTSYRKIEKACKYDICYMWLMDFKKPDHSTFHNFQQRLINLDKEFMISQIQLLLRKNYIDLNELSIDGTKIKSRANKYSSVYRGTVGYHESNMERNTAIALLDLVEQTNQSENSNSSSNNNDDDDGNSNDNSNTTAIEIPEDIKNIITKENPNNNKISNSKQINKKYIPRFTQVEYAQIAKMLGTMSEEEIEEMPAIFKLSKNIDNYFKRKKKYDEQRKLLQLRNSYSKTDIDASFMKMKDDSFDSKELSPGYNVQAVETSGFILATTISNMASDTRQLPNLINYLRSIQALRKKSIILADAGYGSLENYLYLDKYKIKYYIPYMNQRFENRRKFKKNPTTTNKFTLYSPEVLICPNNRVLNYQNTNVNKSASGFETYKHVYEANDCSNCKFMDTCLKKKQKNKRVSLDLEWMQRKEMQNEIFSSEKVKEIYAHRTKVEHVFAQLKHNRKLSKFHNSGIAMNTVILVLQTLSINIEKIHNMELLCKIGLLARNKVKKYKLSKFQFVLFYSQKEYL